MAMAAAATVVARATAVAAVTVQVAVAVLAVAVLAARVLHEALPRAAASVSPNAVATGSGRGAVAEASVWPIST